MDLLHFHLQIKVYLRASNRSQKELAAALSFHPHVLSHKFKGSDNYTLNLQNVKDILLTVAGWGGFNNRQQVLELLALMDLGEGIFTPAQWQSAPLASLIPNPPASSGTAVSVPTAGEAPHNCPTPLTSLVGRQELIEELSFILTSHQTRLLTLTGMGGIGKTRLSLEVAAKCRANFKDGIYFVNLSQVQDAALMPGRIAEILDIRQDGRIAIVSQLKNFLKPKSLLLILDNMEQLLDGTPFISELLKVGPGLKILATSRTLLGIYGEHEVIIPPLSLPPTENAAFASDEPFSEAAQLFIERSIAVNPAFKLSGENEAAIARICSILEGLPLAIELAAAWSKFFTPGALLAQLSVPTTQLAGASGGNRLNVLAGTTPGLPVRHQSLKKLLDWSYNLLTPPERRLFNRVAVFEGSFTWEAAQTICWSGDGPIEATPAGENVFFYLKRLVNQSLLKLYVTTLPGESPVFIMLETVKEYAFEKLQQCGELARFRERHATYYLEMVQVVEPL